MRKYSVKILLIVFMFLLCSSLPEQDAFSGAQKNFMWKVESGTNTVYVLGSIHYLKKENYPLSKTIEDAFEKSDVLAVEADVNDVSKIDVLKLMGTAFYPENDTLENHVSGDTYELVKKEYGKLGIPLWIINKQKPWFLALSLTSLELVKRGFDPDYGIDMHFLSEASGKKKIKELESVDYQINLFSDFSDREQELFLLNTLKDLHAIDEDLDMLIRSWTRGDVKSLESLIQKNEDSEMSSINEKLIYDRNRHMVSKIEDYLRTGEIHFVIVGAGHLVGDKGIIEILKSKGYKAEQM